MKYIFYVQRTKSASQFNMLTSKLESISNWSPISGSPALGDLCVAEFDYAWSRVQVICLNPLTVKYIDFGNSEITTADKLFTIPTELKDIPPFEELPTPVRNAEEIVNPFERRCRVLRSPVNTNRTVSLSETPLSSVTAQSAERASAKPMPYKVVIAMAREEEEGHLRKCLSTLEVYECIFILETSLQHVLKLRKTWQSCEVVSCLTQTSLSLQKRPLTPASNRPASSHAESEVVRRKPRKKPPHQQPEDQAGKREKKKPTKKTLRKHPGGLLISPSEGKSYADVLGEICRKAKSDERGAILKGLRKTRAGDLLVELMEATGSKSNFSADLQSILGVNATVRVLELVDAGGEGPGQTHDRGGG
ncbi:hypothetical protein J6590_042418 [Homalodisca vitripennis]|nr:hypothetical protein J6590_042418 [Homalodisca vitripennis]